MWGRLNQYNNPNLSIRERVLVFPLGALALGASIGVSLWWFIGREFTLNGVIFALLLVGFAWGAALIGKGVAGRIRVIFD